jgi:hypothetical protein
MAQPKHGTGKTWHSQDMAQPKHGTGKTWHSQNMAQARHGTAKTRQTVDDLNTSPHGKKK